MRQDAEWLLRPDVQRGLAAVRDAGLAYDILVRPRELPAALATANALPDMRFVIDHIAKPPIASGEIDAWSALMEPFRSADARLLQALGHDHRGSLGRLDSI